MTLKLHKKDPPKRLIFRSAAASDIGRRPNNEDSYLVNDSLGLFVVADGMGGHEKGEVASLFGSKELENIVKNVTHSVSGEITLDPIGLDMVSFTHEDMLEYAICDINKRLYDKNEQTVKEMLKNLGPAEREFAQLTSRKKRMGTTLVSLFFYGSRAYVTNVGDSRAYRIIDNTIQQLTHDHSWVDERIREGLLTQEEALRQKKKNIITRSVGFKEKVNADIEVMTVSGGERFLLCSDGLSNVLDENVLLNIASQSNLKLACAQMIDKALSRGGKDNITVVLVEVQISHAKTSPQEEEVSASFEEDTFM